MACNSTALVYCRPALLHQVLQANSTALMYCRPATYQCIEKMLDCAGSIASMANSANTATKAAQARVVLASISPNKALGIAVGKQVAPFPTGRFGPASSKKPA
jgi:hypothetical protein